MRKSLRNALIGVGVLASVLGTKSMIGNSYIPKYEFDQNRGFADMQEYIPSFALESGDVKKEDRIPYAVQVDCYKNGKIIPELRSRYPGNIVAKGYFSRGEVLMAHAVHPSLIGLNKDRIPLDSVDEIALSFDNSGGFDKRVDPRGFPDPIRIKVTPEILAQYYGDWKEWEAYYYRQAQKSAEESGVSSGRF
ncbi:hypothetical protein HY212_03570 [Candidatus Pacearchaeota archaeon]|nr:hypothetical protein [Candidatus Pacearchaeota archaeon]